MVPMNFMWCSSQWIHRFLKHLNISWDDDRLRRATGDWPWPPLLSLRTVADPIRNDGAGGAWSTWCPEELELKSSNISHTSLMGALAPWLQIRIVEKPQPNYVCHCENAVKWVKEQGIIFEILNHTEAFLYFLPFPEANCHLSLWMPAAIWVCPKVMKMGVSQSFFPFFAGRRDDPQW